MVCFRIASKYQGFKSPHQEKVLLNKYIGSCIVSPQILTGLNEKNNNTTEAFSP